MRSEQTFFTVGAVAEFFRAYLQSLDEITPALDEHGFEARQRSPGKNLTEYTDWSDVSGSVLMLLLLLFLNDVDIISQTT